MKILVINAMLKESNKEQISALARKYGAEVCFVASERDIPEEFAEPDVIYGFGMEIAKTKKSLKWLCVPSAGVDYLMKPGVFANEECLLSNSSGAYGVSISEHMIAVTLMMMRKLTEFHEETSHFYWGSPRAQRSLWGSRITVLGTGDIGQCFARRARAFEPDRLIGVNRSGKCDEPAFDKMLSVNALDEILPETDLLVMSLPDTPETRGILTRERLWMLPEGAFIVNVGRGSAIDEEALADCLDAGHLAGAALDVFQKEPLPVESRLWKTERLLITPHVAGNLTLEYTLDKNVEMFCEDLVNFAEGKPLKYGVDRKKGY
ncbi:MAG: D-2-hydroxyacid dehydrogenase [Lachnospiraceae bacterium]|nr:D-2-hydroxyacid dehydrogenase [Lachnospiraceae bacterium]